MDEVVCFVTGTGAQAQRYFPHYNSLYSVAALTDASGNVVERFQYDAYGKQKITSGGGAARSRSAVGFDRGFTGYLVDHESGLLHARARQYSPALGRFVSRDPIRHASSVRHGVLYWGPPKASDGYDKIPNQYVLYAVGNSLDPTGKETITVQICEVIIVAGEQNVNDPVKFDFQHKCSAAAFVGCYSELSNPSPGTDNAIPDAPHYNAPMASATEDRRQQANFKDWRKWRASTLGVPEGDVEAHDSFYKTVDGAHQKIDDLCKKCCVRVRFVIMKPKAGPWAVSPLNQRDYDRWIYDCKLKTWTLEE